MVRCSKCGQSKPPEDFQRNAHAKNSRQGYCRPCATIARRDWARKHAATLVRISPEQNRLRSRFHHARGRGIDITWDEFIVLDAQVTCSICKTDVPNGRGKHPIDYDHKTGEVRGVICHDCNHMLGIAKDDPKRLRAAADYLERSLRGKHV